MRFYDCIAKEKASVPYFLSVATKKVTTHS